MALWRTGPAAALLLLGACTAGPDYGPPAVAVPAAYSGGDASGAADSTLARWWAAFDDPVAPYVSTPEPDWPLAYPDYDHLARVREWLLGGGEP